MNIKSLIHKITRIFSDVRKSKGLKARLARGGMWIGLGGSGEMLLRFVRNVILTRILAPEAFGIMAIIFSINAFFETFTEIGIKQAVIQNPKGEEDTFLNGAWWFSFLRVFFLYIAAFLSAPWIADFYKQPELVSLIRVAFLAILCNGVMSSKAYVSVKKMNFRQWAIITNGGGAIGIVLSVILSFYLKNVWALVIGYLFEFLSRTVLSFIICPYIPRLNFSKDNFISLARFAQGMFGIPILVFIFMRFDVFVIGKLMSPVELGLYSMATTLARMPLQFIASVIDQIFMPALSEIQTDHAKINSFLEQSISLIMILGSPILVFLVCFGGGLLDVVYGKPYGQVAIPFAIIFASELLRVSSVPFATTYLAIGNPELHRLFNIIRAAALVILIYPGVLFFGLEGASIASLIAMIFGLYFQLFRINKITGYSIKTYYVTCFKALLGSLIVAVIWFLAFILKMPYFIGFGLGIAGCFAAYGIMLHFFPSLKKILAPSWRR